MIIAGAGSGKTTVMAARVVWLVGTGAGAAPRGARADLHPQSRRRAVRAVRPALAPDRGRAPGGIDESGEQPIMTYDAFAARLVAEHGLRLGVDRPPDLITGATRYRLAARVVPRGGRPVPSTPGCDRATS